MARKKVDQQKFRVRISEKYDARTRRALAKEIIDFVVDRTRNKFEDKRNVKFPKYSKEYTKSLDFKNAGKSKNKVDLTLSSELLDSLKLVGHGEGYIEIGYNKTDRRNNAVAEGNIKGTYGKQRGDSSKRRDYLGISPKDLRDIKENYPIRDQKLSRARARLIEKATQKGSNALDETVLEGGSDE